MSAGMHMYLDALSENTLFPTDFGGKFSPKWLIVAPVWVYQLFVEF